MLVDLLSVDESFIYWIIMFLFYYCQWAMALDLVIWIILIGLLKVRIIVFWTSHLFRIILLHHDTMPARPAQIFNSFAYRPGRPAQIFVKFAYMPTRPAQIFINFASKPTRPAQDYWIVQ